MSQGEEHISVSEVRPRFKIETNLSIDNLVNKLKTGLEKKSAPCEGKVIHGHATLYLPKAEQHYWSPQLSLSLEETNTGSTLRGLYGPRPEVWTLFVLFYSVIGFATLIVSVIGLSFLSLGKSLAILWLVPLLVLVFLSLYLVAYSGKKMGKNQMVTLHKFLEECTGLSFDKD